MRYVEAVLFLVLGVVLLKSGEALQCWKCASDFDSTCRDHFNVTRIMNNRQMSGNADYGNPQIQPVRTNPHLEICDERYTGTYNQKNVCMKRMYKANQNTGLSIVVRECRLVPRNLKAGQCPDEIYSDSGRSIEYCGTCEYDGCNGSSSLSLNSLLAGLIPALILFLITR